MRWAFSRGSLKSITFVLLFKCFPYLLGIRCAYFAWDQHNFSLLWWKTYIDSDNTPKVQILHLFNGSKLIKAQNKPRQGKEPFLYLSKIYYQLLNAGNSCWEFWYFFLKIRLGVHKCLVQIKAKILIVSLTCLYWIFSDC